jgi:peptidyl-tRNA hydrolase
MDIIYFHQNKKEDNTDCMNKFLIVGNIGAEYVNTRHNIGFKILDYFAKRTTFISNRQTGCPRIQI